VFTFTFGSAHRHPHTGESLNDAYVQVPGDVDQSRRLMLMAFGRSWSHQYADPEAAGKTRWSLREIEFPRKELIGDLTGRIISRFMIEDIEWLSLHSMMHTLSGTGHHESAENCSVLFDEATEMVIEHLTEIVRLSKSLVGVPTDQWLGTLLTETAERILREDGS